MKTVQDLKSIQSQSILRLNCPGYGQSSVLSKGGAPPLTEFRVIIVNPLSILHLFDGQADMTRHIDIAVSDGLTSYKLPDDQLINKISADIEYRSQEILQFLGHGGLLVYYLCRPFVLIGGSRFLDNYAWLGGLAPDQSGQSTIGEQTIRHMSTVAHGRNIDKTEEGSNGEFSKYFDQSGIEWNTIIRAEFLTEGYIPLAFAGPKKCIAGQFMVGDHGGQVIFLPAPYSPDFDRVLIDCTYQWNTNNLTEGASDVPEAPLADKSAAQPKQTETKAAHISAKPAAQATPTLKPIPQPAKPSPQPAAQATPTLKPIPQPTKPSPQPAAQATPALKPIPQPGTQPAPALKPLPQPTAQPTPVLKPLPQPAPAQSTPVLKPMPQPAGQKNAKLKEAFAGSPQSTHSNGQDQEPPSSAPLAQEEDLKDNWATRYSLLGIEPLIQETKAVQAQILQLEKQIAGKQQTIDFLEAVKVPLLSGRGGSLLDSCKVVFNALGWPSQAWGTQPNELLLTEDGQPVGLTRISASVGQAQRAEVGNLVESMINYWNEHAGEPKGIFVVCSFADTPINERQQPDFSPTEIEFAQHKNICLLSTIQLLYIYRDIRLHKIDVKALHQQILNCSGCLPGFTE